MVVAVTGERLAAAQCVHSSLPGAHTKWETVTYSLSCDLGKVYISSLCSFLWNSKRYIWLKAEQPLKAGLFWYLIHCSQFIPSFHPGPLPTSYFTFSWGSISLPSQSHMTAIPASYRTQKSQAAIPGTFQSLSAPMCGYFSSHSLLFFSGNETRISPPKWPPSYGHEVLPAKRHYPLTYPAPPQPFILLAQ